MKDQLEQLKQESLTKMYEDALEGMTQDDIVKLISEVNSLRSQLKHQMKTINRLKQQALHDPLTKLPNRRSFEEELDKSLAFHARYGRMGALMVIDANDFKTINDSLGHMAGDAVLCHIANLLKQHTRLTDVVARVGGDEFCLILREVSDEEAKEKAERLARLIASAPCSFDGREIYISVSVGACGFGEAKNKADLFQKADSAMYDDKSTSKVAVA